METEKNKAALPGASKKGSPGCVLFWAGKEACKKEASSSCRALPELRAAESVNWSQTGNLYFEGDNLDTLKLLQTSCRNSIRLIYIDPPYNTGNDFIYHDDFSPDDSRKSAGKNADSHSAWCSMMYPRLFLARALLADDGLLFVSIDDNELANLRKICDEIFGEENYVNLITIKSKTSSGASGGGEDRRLKKNTEYLYIYARSKERARLHQPEKLVSLADYRSGHRASKTGFYYTRILTEAGEKKLLSENGGIRIYERKGFRFSTVREKIAEEHLTEDEVYSKYFDRIFMVTNAQTSILEKVNRFTPREQMLVSYEYTPKTGRNRGIPTEKFVWNRTLVVWLADSAEKRDGIVYKREKLGTLWDDISWGRLDLQGGVPFKNGKKPLKLMERVLQMATDRDSTVLDFFSGSATTAQAVMELNARDGGSRKFILAQLPEPCGKNSAAFRAGLCDICAVGRERIRKAGADIRTSFARTESQLRLDRELRIPPDTGFRVLRLSKKRGACGDGPDFLFGVLLRSGLPLSLPVTTEQLCGRTVYFAGGSLMAACPGPAPVPEFLRALADRHPRYAAFSKASVPSEQILSPFFPAAHILLF